MKETDDYGFIRELEFSPAHDLRHPNPNRNGGIHCVEMRFYLTGPLGVVQFVLYTGWHLPAVQTEFMRDAGGAALAMAPMPADIGYHSPTPIYEGQDISQPSCPHLDGIPCYYDGSGLNARRPFEILLTEGEEALWDHLRAYYYSTFHEEGQPGDPIDMAGRMSTRHGVPPLSNLPEDYWDDEADIPF